MQWKRQLSLVLCLILSAQSLAGPLYRYERNRLSSRTSTYVRTMDEEVRKLESISTTWGEINSIFSGLKNSYSKKIGKKQNVYQWLSALGQHHRDLSIRTAIAHEMIEQLYLDLSYQIEDLSFRSPELKRLVRKHKKKSQKAFEAYKSQLFAYQSQIQAITKRLLDQAELRTLRSQVERRRQTLATLSFEKSITEWRILETKIVHSLDAGIRYDRRSQALEALSALRYTHILAAAYYHQVNDSQKRERVNSLLQSLIERHRNALDEVTSKFALLERPHTQYASLGHALVPIHDGPEIYGPKEVFGPEEPKKALDEDEEDAEERARQSLLIELGGKIVFPDSQPDLSDFREPNETGIHDFRPASQRSRDPKVYASVETTGDRPKEIQRNQKGSIVDTQYVDTKEKLETQVRHQVAEKVKHVISAPVHELTREIAIPEPPASISRALPEQDFPRSLPKRVKEIRIVNHSPLTQSTRDDLEVDTEHQVEMIHEARQTAQSKKQKNELSQLEEEARQFSALQNHYNAVVLHLTKRIRQASQRTQFSGKIQTLLKSPVLPEVSIQEKQKLLSELGQLASDIGDIVLGLNDFTEVIQFGSVAMTGRTVFGNEVSATERYALGLSALIPFVPLSAAIKATKTVEKIAEGVLLEAKVVNAILATKGYTKAPFRIGTKVIDVVTRRNREFVRFFNPDVNNMKGAWLVPKSTVRGLTPVQIRSKLGLSYTPTQIVHVYLDKGAKLYIGKGEKFDSALGNSVQYYNRSPKKASFGKSIDLKPNHPLEP